MIIAEIDIHDDVVKEIGKFTILWNMFEKKYTKYGNEKNYIELAHTLEFSPEIFEEIRVHLLNQRCLRINDESQTDEFVKVYLFSENARLKPDKLSKEFLPVKFICQFLDKEGLIEEQQCGCLYAVERYRNNLLHGIKSLNDLEEQLNAFKAINLLLEDFAAQ